MAETIIDRLRWFSYGKQKLEPQDVPSHDQLIAFGAEETGNRLCDYESERKDFKLPDGRDDRTYAIVSDKVDIIYVPDEHGFYVENGTGLTWRPKDLDELRDLIGEMDHQLRRYGELL